MSSGLEIERKFLVDMPDIRKLNVVKNLNIIQTYLRDGENGTQRRVRKVKCNNDVFMTYTEKKFISPVVREEKEFNINSDEYKNLLKEAKNTSVVKKNRIEFEYKNQNFEMDIYPFSEKFAILELELENADQKIEFPKYVKVIKEVSDDKRYSNASLANAGAFPEN